MRSFPRFLGPVGLISVILAQLSAGVVRSRSLSLSNKSLAIPSVWLVTLPVLTRGAFHRTRAPLSDVTVIL